MIVRGWAVWLGLVLAVGGGPVAAGQERPERQRPELRGQRRPGPQSRPQVPPGQDLADRPHRRPPGAFDELPLRPEPGDLGPLRPDEARALFDFAREHMPFAARMMQQARQRDPEEFQQQLERLAPRLRHLKRIFERRPELGERIVQHTRNLQAIKRMARVWNAGPRSPERRERLREALRKYVAENLRIEVQILDDRVTELEANREARAEETVGELAGGEMDLLKEPPLIRELVAAVQSAADDAEEAAARDALRAAVERRIDGEIERFRHHAERLRSAGAEEVERRIDEVFERAESRPEHGPRPGRDERPRRDDRPRGGRAGERPAGDDGP